MNIGIYIYDNAEVLDFSGPFEVFSVAARLAESGWKVFLVSETGNLVNARGNFLVKPHYAISNHPEIDVLIVAGGIHAEEVKKGNVVNWVSRTSESAKLVASVCTGCFLLWYRSLPLSSWRKKQQCKWNIVGKQAHDKSGSFKTPVSPQRYLNRRGYGYKATCKPTYI